MSKKFGTFGGVFTPSILTILGVIMYLRLPYIVGQAGLYMTLAIIGIAHIIAITTGLSVASIATDKKVKAGGTYFMISRSLGLPIGGTLGIALFVGMSLSISLYLIGFSETFLGYWDLPGNKNSIRLTGSITLGVVALVTIISTSLAMKTQYLIMGAIGLSLATILIGHGDATIPAAPHLAPLAGAVGFATLFGIYFPAVTGFEAGVSMSGDLKDPKKSIPVGTIAAIVVGFIVYVGLAVFLAVRVDADSLANDPAVLNSLSFFPPLLMAGIWGATISSALGSILGAPRILQATAMDRITPKFFAKGSGESNEPRNALILTILLAEAGILIAELDVIARIVSMFFITAYGFLNISCAVESIVSPDFRPGFRIPRWISFVGASTCVVVMIQLDIVAMMGATMIMGLMFLYLKRRELTLESGDAYQSIWSSVVRRGLRNLSRTRVHERNWRPNILLFSGGEDARPELVAIARNLAGGRGIVSNVELVETTKPRLRPRSQETPPADGPEFDGMFFRRIECENIYEAMQDISRYYGFAGVEPNTVLMGRARRAGQAEPFAALTQSLRNLDYNLLLFESSSRKAGDAENHSENHFDDRSDPSAPPRVDCWWSGYGNSLALILALIRILQNSEQWRSARFRLLLIAETADSMDFYRRQLKARLEETRIQGEVQIVFNGVNRRNFEEIISEESGPASLVLLGLPDFSRERPAAAVERMNRFSERLSRIIWLRASSFFQELETAPVPASANLAPGASLPVTAEFSAAPPADVHDEELSSFLTELRNSAGEIYQSIYRGYFDAERGRLRTLFAEGAGLGENIREEFEAVQTAAYPIRQRALTRAFGDFLYQLRRLQSAGGAEENAEALDAETAERFQGEFERRLSEIVELAPRRLKVKRNRSHFLPPPGAGPALRLWLQLRRFRVDLGGGAVDVAVYCRSIFDDLLAARMPEHMIAYLREMQKADYAALMSFHRVLTTTETAVRSLDHKAPEGGALAEFSAEQDRLAEVLSAEKDRATAAEAALRLAFQSGLDAVIGELGDLMSRQLPDQKPARTKFERPRSVSSRRRRRFFARLSTVFRQRRRSARHFSQMREYDLELAFARNRIRSLADRQWAAVEAEMHPLISSMRLLNESLAGRNQASDASPLPLPPIEDLKIQAETLSGAAFAGDLRPVFAGLPDEADLLTEATLARAEQGKFETTATASVALRRYLDSVMETEFTPALREIFRELDSAVTSAAGLVRRLRREYGLDRPGARTGTRDAASGPLETAESSERSPDALPNDIQELEQENENLREKVDGSARELEQALERALEKFSPFFFASSTDQFDLFVRQVERRRLYDRVLGVLRRTGERFTKNILRLVYGPSRAKVYAGRLSLDRSANRVHAVLDQLDDIALRPEVARALPRYCRHLFLEKPLLSRDLYIERDIEAAAIGECIRYFRAGRTGLIFLTGERETGKTVLARASVERHFPRPEVFEVFALGSGGCSAKYFDESVARAGVQANSQEGVCIVNDLELFWERSEKGLAAIDRLFERSRRAPGPMLFVVTVGASFFRYLRLVRPELEDLALGVVPVGPMAADDLQALILARHKITGLRFDLNGVPEERVSPLALARHFHRIFESSGGRAGAALRTWLASARVCRDRRLELVTPSAAPVLPELPADWLTILAQLTLYKRADHAKLARLFQGRLPGWEGALEALVRAGLVARKNGVCEVEAGFAGPVLRTLTRAGVL